MLQSLCTEAFVGKSHSAFDERKSTCPCHAVFSASFWIPENLEACQCLSLFDLIGVASCCCGLAECPLLGRLHHQWYFCAVSVTTLCSLLLFGSCLPREDWHRVVCLPEPYGCLRSGSLWSSSRCFYDVSFCAFCFSSALQSWMGMLWIVVVVVLIHKHCKFKTVDYGQNDIYVLLKPKYSKLMWADSRPHRHYTVFPFHPMGGQHLGGPMVGPDLVTD